MNNNRSKIISIFAAVITMLIGIMGIIGWVTHNNFLSEISPGQGRTKFNVPLGFVFSSIVLLLYHFPEKNKTRHLVSILLSVVVSLIGLLTLIEYIFDFNFGIDELLFKEELPTTAIYYAGRMSPLSALNFILIGIGLLLLNKEKTAAYQFFYLEGIAFVSLLMLIGFNFIADIPTFIRLAIPVAIGFIILSTAIYFAQPMLQKKISFQRKLFTGFTAVIILIAVLSIFSSYYSDKRISTSQSVNHTNNVLSEAGQTLSLMKDIESGGRGYIITGDSSYLEYFTIAKTSIFNHIKRLKELTKDNPSQQVKIDSLSALVDKRIGFSLQLIQARNEKGFEAANNLMATRVGNFFTNKIRKITGEIQQEENGLLIKRQKENDESIVSFNRAFIVLLAGVFLLLAIILFSIRNNIAVRKKAQVALTKLNNELEQKVLERTEEINRSEKRYRYLFENSPMPMWVIDLNTFKFLDVNEMAILQYGYSREEFLSMTTLDIRPDEGKELFKQPEHLFEMGRTNYSKGIWSHRKKDGTIIQVETIGHKISFEGVPARLILSNDVTEKKKAEDLLIKSEKQYRNLFENNPMPLWVIDLATFEFLDVNEAAISHYGYSREEFLSMTAVDIRPEEEKERYKNTDHSENTNPADNKRGTWKHLKKDGTIINVEIIGHQIIFDGKKARLILSHDITEQKLLKQQKDNFLSIASHELKTPVTTVKAYAQIAESLLERKGDVETLGMIKRMGIQVNKLTNLIEDLLDFTKIRKGKLTYNEAFFDFNELVKEVIDDMQKISPTHEIKNNLGESANIFGDKDKLSQGLNNLISNATKYSPGASSIVISSELQTNGIQLSVQDFGIGISEHEQRNLFEQFYRVYRENQSTFPGMGIGLFICSEIMARHGGKIWIESTIGKGSTFYIWVPFDHRNKIK